MASLPSPTQVSGKHNAVYEAYYKQMDPKGMGTIEAMDAAKFLKKSGLSDVVLSRIWDLSDPKGRGCLDKAGFFVSLKLVALAQSGTDINMRNILAEMANPPKVGELPKIVPQAIQSVPPMNNDWTMKPTDRIKYEALFESLNPVGGMIAGNKVKSVLMDSKLPLETLGKIWDLADQDKDGNLDKHEFIVAMHLVYQTLDKRAVPTSLPVELQKPKSSGPPTSVTPVNEGFGDGGFVANFPTDIAPPPVPPLPAIMTAAARVPPPAAATISSVPLIPTDPIMPLGGPIQPAAYDWIVSPSDRVRYEAIFRDSDKDRDGLVSGLEVKNVFIQSGVPQNCLAHIWALCDTNQSGKLTVEQFALAMYFVEQKKKGFEPPEALAPNMIPPSLRGSAGIEPTIVAQEAKPTYSNPELEMISKEIEELARERRLLETDIAQKEADIRIKSGEVRSLQSELDTLAATLKQLENQKGEAQKRLDDLKTQKVEIDDALANFNVQIETTRLQVNKIREQCQKQEATINEQEGELNSKKSELQKLKDEESALEKEYDSNRHELDNLTKQLQDTQLQISQVKAMVTQLLETQRQMNDALLMCRAAIEANDAVLVSDYSLKIEPDFSEARQTLVKQEAKKNAFNDDHAFASNNTFGNTTNGFGSTDPFANTNGNRATAGFDDSFSNAPLSGFDDAFGSSAFGAGQTRDPFAASSAAADPFGDKTAKSVTPEPGKDDFGSDPFANLHAPTSAGQVLSPSAGQKSGPPPRPESPSPALPPKKSKQPPPRPAPPRPLQGPTRPALPATDSFGSSGGFTDFADFDKLPNIMSLSTASTPSLPSSNTLTSSPFGTSVSPSAMLNSTKSLDTSQNNANHSTTTCTDFAEDPFKDYRYEDPFNIKDPFADEDDGEKSSDDIFSDSSAKDYATTTTNPNTDSDFHKTPSPFHMPNSNRTNMFPSPVVSQSPHLGTQENFASFDAFDSNTTASTIGKDPNRNDDFFDAFNDNFKIADRTNLNTNPSTTFDPFGTAVAAAAVTTTASISSKPFDPFNDNFDDDDFYKTAATAAKTTTTTTTDAFKTEIDDRTNGNFASFDDFGDSFGAASFTTTATTTLNNSRTSPAAIKLDGNFKQNNLKTKVTNDATSTKVADRFVEDYSKGDSFEDDLKRALQLSLVDQ